MTTLTPPREPQDHTLPTAMAPDEFPQGERRGDRTWNEWMMVAVGLTALMSVLATVLAIAAVASGGGTTTTVITTPARLAATPAAATTAAAIAPESVRVAIKADSEHGRLGPDGQWHDAFVPADFTVHAGAKVTVSFANYDSGPHSFTAPTMGVNAIVPGGGTMGTPTRQTVTFTAPTKPGRYAWKCTIPCDPWAMMHDGYMEGYVTVVA